MLLKPRDSVAGVELLSGVEVEIAVGHWYCPNEKGFYSKENLKTGKNVRHFYRSNSKIIFKKFKSVGYKGTKFINLNALATITT